VPESTEENSSRQVSRGTFPWLVLCLVAILLISASAARVVDAPRAFTHVDDIGVASTILEARREVRSAQDLRALINNPRLRQYGSSKFRLLRKADAAGVLGPAFGAFAVARDVLAVPARWTYAPAQYLVTAPLLSDAATYKTTLIAGRAPSAVFSIAAIALLVFAAWRVRPAGEATPALMAMAVMALSLEFLVYSTHMSNYALGVLASVALLLLATFDPTRWRRAWSAIALGVGTWGLILASYQTLPLIAAALASIGLTGVRVEWSRGADLKGKVVGVVRSAWLHRLVLAGVIFVLLMIPTYLVLLSSVRPITWNAGPQGEFVFPGLHAGPTAIGEFVARNGWLTFSAMTTPLAWGHPLRAPLTAAFAALFLLGLARLLSDHSKPRRFATGLFIALSLLATIAMSVLGLTALSPTRHALILLPMFALGVAEGTALGLRLAVPQPGWRALAGAAAVAVLMAIWAQALPGEMARRRDPFDEAGLAARIATDHPAALLTYGFTYAPDLMPAVRAEVALFNRENLNFPWFAGRLPKADGPTLVISSSGPLTDADRRQLAQALALSTPSTTPWRWCPHARVIWAEERAGRSDVEVYPIAAGGVNGYFAYLTAPCGAGEGGA